MRIGKSGFSLNVYKTEQGGGGAQVRAARETMEEEARQ